MALVKVLTDPRTIVAGVVTGFVAGRVSASFGQAAAPYGAIYVALLSMCVLPMMTCAIISGLGQMLRSRHTRPSFRKLVAAYALGLLVPSLAGILAAEIGRPGVGLEPTALSELGEEVLSSAEPAAPAGGGRLLVFIGRIVPHNIFAAYAKGSVVSIVFVSILIGIAVGLVRSHRADDALQHVAVAYETFELMFKWMIYLLPIGLFCLITGVASTVNPVLLRALGRYIIVFCVAAVGLLILYHCLLWRLAGGGFSHPLSALREALLVAFLANNSLITIPVLLEAAKKEFGLNLRLDLVAIEDLSDPINIAVRPDSPHLLAWIDTYLLIQAPALSARTLLDRFGH
jgi:proton glutamate symport protein